jgi:hypothetical protein
MEKNLLDNTAVPDLAKLDFEIAAFTFGKRKIDKHSDNRADTFREKNKLKLGERSTRR